MQRFLFLFITCLCITLFSCRGKETTAEPTESSDSLLPEVRDTLFVGAQGAIFEDVASAYLHDSLALKDYVFVTLYASAEESEKAEKKASTDTAWIYVIAQATDSARYAMFAREEAQKRWWVVHEVYTDSVPPLIAFYKNLAVGDARFLRQHLHNPVNYSTFDDDSFERVEGVFIPEQWPDFAPKLPVEQVAFIVYGGHAEEAETPVLRVDCPKEGMSSTLSLKRTAKGWMLMGLEN